jgi:hypothetical protein
MKNIIAYSTEKNIGFVDMYKYLNMIYESKKSGFQSEETENFIKSIESRFGLTFSQMNKSEIKQQINKLEKEFNKRHDFLVDFETKMTSLFVINDTEIVEEEAKLSKLRSMITNKEFINEIRLIEQNINNASDKDLSKYQIYKKIQSEINYLVHFKIGSSKMLFKANDKVEDAKNHLFAKVSRVADEIYDNMTSIGSLLKDSDIKSALDLWRKQQYQSLLSEMESNLDEQFNFNKNKLYLKPKLLLHLSRFFNISIAEADVMASKNNFRTEIFGTFDYELNQVKLNKIKGELNEHELVMKFFESYKRTTYHCPVCLFRDPVQIRTRLHIADAHSTHDSYKEFKPILGYEVVRQVDKYTSVYSADSSESQDGLMFVIKQKFIAPQYEQINKVVANKYHKNNVEKDLLFPKVDKQMKKEQANKRMIAELEQQYTKFQEAGLINKKDLKDIKKIISEEIMNKNKLVVYSNVQIKVMNFIMKKTFKTTDVSNASEEFSAFLEKKIISNIIKTKNDKLVIHFEKLLNNFKNYKNNNPLTFLSKSLVDLLTLIKNLKTLKNPKDDIKIIKNQIIKSQPESYTAKMLNIKKDGEIEAKYQNVLPEASENLMAFYILMSYFDNDIISTELASKNGETGKNTSGFWKFKFNEVWSWKNKKNLNNSAYELLSDEATMENIFYSLFNTEDQTYTGKFNELLKALNKIKVSDINAMIKNINTMAETAMIMFRKNIMFGDVDSEKSFEELKRELYISFMMKMQQHFLNKLMTITKNKKVINFLLKYILTFDIFLNEEPMKEKKQKKKVIIKTTEDKEEVAKDELLNDFFDMDFDAMLDTEEPEDTVFDVEETTQEQFDFDIFVDDDQEMAIDEDDIEDEPDYISDSELEDMDDEDLFDDDEDLFGSDEEDF